jgi:hypothetical protein
MRTSLVVVLVSAALLPSRAAGALSIVGFSRRGHQVLFRDDDGLKLFGRDGRPRTVTRGVERRCRYGRPLKTGALKLDTEKRRLALVWKGQTIQVWSPGAGDGCAPLEVSEARLARDRLTVALVLRQECEPPARALVISLAAVARRLANRGTTLARRGKRKASEQALRQADLLHPGSPLVLYARARAAALAADERGAVSLLKKLKAQRGAAARRLFVKAQFDRDFRLVEGSAAFKSLYRF